MKNRFTRIMCLLLALILTCTPLSVCAEALEEEAEEMLLEELTEEEPEEEYFEEIPEESEEPEPPEEDVFEEEYEEPSEEPSEEPELPTEKPEEIPEVTETVPEETEIISETSETIPEEPSEEPTEATEETVPEEEYVTETDFAALDEDFFEQDELVWGYLYEQSGMFSGMMPMSVGTALSGMMRDIYDGLVPKIKSVAANGGCTVLKVSFSKYDGKLNANALLGAITSTLPYDLYWFDKTVGIGLTAVYNTSTLAGEATVILAVSRDYADASHQHTACNFAKLSETYKTKYGAWNLAVTSDVSKIKAAANNAKQIVADYEGFSDYDKLNGYRAAVCELASYNSAGGNGSWEAQYGYGNPWQLIWVFDGDSSTEVVCEGYAKAFKYLCDLSYWNNDVVCNIATGTMGSERHMWNIVSINGSNYLTDITNCDYRAVGYPNRLFLCGAAPYGTNAYKTSVTSKVYTYDSDTVGFLSASERTLSPYGYSALGKLSWNFVDGKLTVTGTGPLEVPVSGTLPWEEFLEEIEEIVIGSGITSLCDNAFTGCSNLMSVSIPASVASLGRGTFAGCVNLTKVTFASGSKVTGIPESAFEDCTSLKRITIPAGVTYIGSRAFGGCTALCQISFPTKWPSVAEDAFEGCDNLVTTEIHYALDGGTNNASNPIEYLVGASNSITLQNPTKKGFTFAGWYKNSERTVKAAAPEITPNIVAEAGGELTFYAKWTENTYKVSLQPNGGTGTVKTVSGIKYTEDKIIDCPFTRKGYFFAAWSTKSDGSGTYFRDQSPISRLTPTNGSTVTLYAQWEPVPYSITYNLNGGTETYPTRYPEEYSVTQAVTLDSPTRPGYTFAGWSGSGYTGITKIAAGTIGDLVLTAKWTPKTYTITYDLGGGSLATANPASYKTGTPPVLKYTPTRKGYAFVGWYLSGAETPVEFTKETYGNVKLYAHWEPIHYTVQFSANSSLASGEMETVSMTYGTYAVLPESAFEREGYHFGSWNTASDGSGTEYGAGASVRNLTSKADAQVTLYVRWAPNSEKYTIVFDINGGKSGTTASMTGRSIGTKYTLTPNGFKKTGYHFMGWATSPDGPVVYADQAKVKDLDLHGGTVTLYAVWEHNKYKVTYDGNGGSYVPEGATTAKTAYSQTMYYNTEATMTALRFSRKGYTFVCWCTTADGKGTRYEDGQTAVFNLTKTDGGKVTLYAIWKANQYTVVYDLNGAEGTLANQTMTYGKAANLRSMTITRPGYRFTGWTYNSKTYANKEQVKNLTSKPNAVVTLTAKWSRNTYSVQFNPNGGPALSTKVFATQTGLSLTKKQLAVPTKEPARSGYTFRGWNTKSGGTGVQCEPGTSVDLLATTNKQVFTLYAQWDYSVKFNGNGAEQEETVKETWRWNKTYTLSARGFSKTGYYLAGWNTSKTKADAGTILYKATEKVKNIGANKTLYAVWKPITYTVKFYANGGTGSMAAQSMTYQKSAALTANAFTWKGHSFHGWAESADGPVVYTNKQKVKNLTTTKGAVIKLYAVWS